MSRPSALGWVALLCLIVLALLALYAGLWFTQLVMAKWGLVQ